jgi:hypothetical protein
MHWHRQLEIRTVSLHLDRISSFRFLSLLIPKMIPAFKFVC